jgi:hypothetical protein
LRQCGPQSVKQNLTAVYGTASNFPLGLKLENPTQKPKGLVMARKTIEYAVAHLASAQAALIQRAWKATRAEDLYDGRLNSYLQVIAETLEKQNEKMYTMKSAAHTLKGIIEANF